MVHDRRDFVGYARLAAPRLRDTAYLMCRDWHLAEDLAQTALTKLFVSWGRVSRAENVDAYAHQVLLRSFLDYRRRRSSTEVAAADLPELAVPGSPDLRLTLMDALAALGPKDRAVVILRYWEDYSIEQVAQMLGMSSASVKTRSHRSLLSLRQALPNESFGRLV